LKKILKASNSKIYYLTFLFAILFFSNLSAQKYEIGLGFGSSNYKGDIAPGFYPEFSRPAGSIFFRNNVSTAVSFKFSLMKGALFADDSKADDNYSKIRNMQFTTRITELTAQFEYNFINFRDPQLRKLGTPYLLMGIGAFKMNSLDANTNDKTSNIQLCIPFGLGYRRILTDQWNIGLEFAARKTFTDYIDNLGGDLSSNKFQNGNPFDKDMYFFSQLTLSYTFYSIKCPF